MAENRNPWANPASSSDTRAVFLATPGSGANAEFALLDSTPSDDIGDGIMADPTREEYDAKLEAVEARLDAKLVGIDGKLDRLVDRIETVVTQSRDAKDSADKALAAASSMKWNILATALGVVAVLFAAWAIWAQGIEMVSGLFEHLPKGD